MMHHPPLQQGSGRDGHLDQFRPEQADHGRRLKAAAAAIDGMRGALIGC
jgi:hypothetical protein